MQAVFDTVDGVSGGYPLVMASCNSAESISTALLRRFPGRYFFGLPNRESKDQMWADKKTRYNLDPTLSIPDDDEWTGAEIDVCCDRAARRKMDLITASQIVIPVAKARPGEMIQMCREAHHKYLDASTGLPYIYVDPSTQEAIEEQQQGRHIVLPKKRGN